MAILKIERNTPRSIRDMFRYMVDPEKIISSSLFGIGVNEMMADIEMEFIHRIYHYVNMKHPYIQVIFAFDEGYKDNPLNTRNICKKIAEILIYGNDDTQVFGAIHYNHPYHIHAHFMINSITVNGKLFRQAESINWYRNEINCLLTANNLPIIKERMII